MGLDLNNEHLELLWVDGLDGLDREQWQGLQLDDCPFLAFDFLRALDVSGSAGPRFGWSAHFLLARLDGRLLAAVPMYLKENSYGELVFDWAWADAWQRLGLRYYPKAVVTVPYTPAAGPRLLLAEDAPPGLAARLVDALLERVQALGLSSLHCLFVDRRQAAVFDDSRFTRRLDCQFQWHNHAYGDFDDFLARLSSKKRKNIRRERRAVAQSGLRVVSLAGDEIDEALWSVVHRFYASTFERKGGTATLSLAFFLDVAASMGERIRVFLAYDGERPVAAAILFHNDSVLWGRHWGADPAVLESVSGLHFELCYYLGIEFCIERGLQRFEPGAQGAFKQSRGFDPVLTQSFHWVADERLRPAVERFCSEEAEAVGEYVDERREHSAYRRGG